MKALNLPRSTLEPLRAAGTLGAIVFCACLFGIYTRPIGFLAAVWPANALLLGILVLNPRLATRYGYIGATIGYILADLMTGARLFPTLLLTAANLAGVSVGHLLFSRLDYDNQRLRQPHAVLYLLVISAAAAIAAGIGGGVIGPVLFNDWAIAGGPYWFATEFVNYIAILPVLLSAPTLAQWRQFWTDRRTKPHFSNHLAGDIRLVLPGTALLLSCGAAQFLGGPGAVAFPVPALLWCALVYSQWTSAIFTLIFSLWILLTLKFGNGIPIDLTTRTNLLSLRIGIALIALGPVMVASVMAARNELVRRLERIAAHDHLTGLLNHRSFGDMSAALLADLAVAHAPVSLLMLDIDHFKTINDTYGHPAGDLVLRSFAAVIRKCTRETEFAARLGGEEFGILIPHCRPEEAAAIAERICTAFAGEEILTSDRERIMATVSIGVTHAERAPPDLDGLLQSADAALYRAKAAGRNRVELAWRDGASVAPLTMPA